MKIAPDKVIDTGDICAMDHRDQFYMQTRAGKEGLCPLWSCRAGTVVCYRTKNG